MPHGGVGPRVPGGGGTGEAMFDDFPKKVTLRDGGEVILRPMVREDEERLLEFFARVPPEDRLFLREDVSKRETIEGWVRHLDYDRVLPILAEANGRIVADATLHRRKMSWTSHTGKVRVVIDKEYRGRGLGSKLIGTLIDVGRDAGLDKLVAEVLVTQHTALRAFERLGFERAAVLPNYVKDQTGAVHDLVVLIYDLAAEWEFF